MMIEIVKEHVASGCKCLSSTSVRGSTPRGSEFKLVKKSPCWQSCSSGIFSAYKVERSSTGSSQTTRLRSSTLIAMPWGATGGLVFFIGDKNYR